MHAFDTVQLQHDARGFATLWLNRPEKRNAFDALMINELTQALADVEGASHVRFLLLRGRGQHFCAGADLAWMQASASLGEQRNRREAQALGELMARLAQLALPTLAVVQGAAIGGAVGLVSCCDMAIGSTDALFSLSEVRLGLAPALISPYVVQAIGPRAARRYALSAERFDGQRAASLGLLNEACTAEQLEARLEHWVTQLLLNGPEAMRATKALLTEVGSGITTPQVRRACEDTIARLRTGAEGQEGLRAFLEKRPPHWQTTQEQTP
ncbi:enoyl-CoA hydratase-related protein [Pseudomonas sp. nanlin1]|uniref:enoyl-CoA hydratase-related protein n=1 Tax=Pseudomonas sp. nanlin1 TaxID=3040605 RepID=UPI00388DEC8B